MRFALALLAALLPAAALAQTLVTPPDFKTPSRATQGVTKGYVDSATSTLGTAVGLKADKTYVDTGLAGKVPEAPNDGTYYVRRNNGWTASPAGTVTSSAITTALGFTPANKSGDTFTGLVVVPSFVHGLSTRTANSNIAAGPGDAATVTIPYAPPTGYIQGDHLRAGTLINTKASVFNGTVQEAGLVVMHQVGPDVANPGTPSGGPDDAINNGNTAFGFTTTVNQANMNAWGIAGGIVTSSNASQSFYAAVEVDTTFQHGDCAILQGNCYGLFFNSINQTIGTAQVYGSGNAPSGHWSFDAGILFQDQGSGGKYLKNYGMWDNTSARIGYRKSGVGGDAGFQSDGSQSFGFRAMGTYGFASFDTTVSPTSISLNMANNQVLKWPSFDSLANGTAWYVRNSSSVPVLSVNGAGDVGFARRLYASGNSPSLSSCGSSPSLSTGANDTHGTITIGSGGTSCTLNFSANRVNSPDCVIMAKNAGAPISAVSTTIGAFAFTAGGAPAGQSYTYHCMGQ